MCAKCVPFFSSLLQHNYSMAMLKYPSKYLEQLLELDVKLDEKSLGIFFLKFRTFEFHFRLLAFI